MKTLIMSVILTALLGQVPARAQIDSAQWPFPKTLSLNCNLGGIYSFTHWEEPNSYEQSVDTSVFQVPEYVMYQLWFTWKNVQKIDSNEWQLANQVATLNLSLDTINHRIDTLTFNYGSDYEEELSFKLKNLYYTASTIGYGDNDINRHLISASYGLNFKDCCEIQTTTYCCTFEFGLFGQTLVPGFLLTHQVNFGTLLQDSSRDTTVTIINYSDSAVAILSFALNDPDSGFAFVDTTVHTIPANESETITVRFTPKQLKSYSGAITIVTDEACTHTYTINLNGAAVPSSVKTSSEDSNFTASLVTQQGHLLLQLSSSYSSAQIDVFDILGHKHASMNKSLNAEENLISLNNLIGTPGEYIVRIQSGNDVRSLKFVIAQ